MLGILAAPLFTGIVGQVWLIVVVVIAVSLLVFALRTLINAFVPDPHKPKAHALLYIVVALILAALLLRWVGLM